MASEDYFIDKMINLSLYVLITRNYGCKHRWRAKFQQTSLWCWWQIFVGTMVSGYTKLLYYVGNNRTSNCSSLTMLLGNTSEWFHCDLKFDSLTGHRGYSITAQWIYQWITTIFGLFITKTIIWLHEDSQYSSTSWFRWNFVFFLCFFCNLTHTFIV